MNLYELIKENNERIEALQASSQTINIQQTGGQISLEDSSTSSNSSNSSNSNNSSTPSKQGRTKLNPTTPTARYRRVNISKSNISKIQKRYIAFDVETTGLSSTTDRIVELGAVLFENGRPVDSFSALVNPNKKIPYAATRVNNITNAMLKTAPKETEVYPELIEFLENAITGDTVIVAHNAIFDLSFLGNTFNRLGLEANFRYLDTLGLSREHIPGLKSYSQRSLEKHFGLSNRQAHRAEADAEICGQIFWRILNTIDAELQAKQELQEKLKPTQEELELCAYFQTMIVAAGGDTSWLRFHRNSDNYVIASVLDSFLAFKFTEEGHYLIVDKDMAKADLPTRPCSDNEGGANHVRVYFTSPYELTPLAADIVSSYEEAYATLQDFISLGSLARKSAKEDIAPRHKITKTQLRRLLRDINNRTYDDQQISFEDLF